MQLLLIDPNSGRHSQWMQQFSAGAFQWSLVATTDQAANWLSSHSCTVVAVHDETADCESLPQRLTEYKYSFQSLLYLASHANGASAQKAFVAGYDDFLPADLPADAWETILQRAHETQLAAERFARAQKLESIGELAAGIAHEINTPIQYVGDNTRFIQQAWNELSPVLLRCQSIFSPQHESTISTEDLSELAETVAASDIDYLSDEVPLAIAQALEGVDRVATIVRAMKEFAHPGSSEMTLTDLGQALRNTVTVARNEWKYVADLVLDVDPQLPPVPCLPGELNQVFLNMIVNAAHAVGDAIGESPDRKGLISVSVVNNDPHAEIKISDNGLGIAPDNLQKIFAPFFTTKPVGKGTGQGLAIAHTVIVEKHGGTIDVASVVGEGTTFTIRIPLQRAKTEATPSFVPELASKIPTPLVSLK